MTGFEENDISLNSQGGTELTKRSYVKNISKELQEHFQIIPSRIRNIKEDKIRIYWCHDMPDDPELNHLKDASSRNRFHKIIWNSNWQFNDALLKLKFPRDFKHEIIETGIQPIPYKVKPTDKINLIYFSTPQRGLEILVPVFIELAKKYNNIHLDVFSSFKIYGWENMDEKYEPLYEKIRQHPQMTYHGFANHDTVVDHLQKAHILAYPCIWQETSCRVLIESMSAGLMCVHSNLGALPDTSGMLTLSYQYQDDYNVHASLFHHYLDHAINSVNVESTQNYLGGFVKTYADLRFNLNAITKKWELLMNHLVSEYPTTESRKIKQEQQIFSYKT
jgi:UDP-glucose:(glucosyl)LPS alpha-1,2-glucosyltransferase